MSASRSRLDVGRSWFRYHHLFSDLLQLELRRTAPDELPRLHTAAAEWFAEHGDPIEAIRHAQAAENWRLASRLLWDNGVDLYISGRAAAVHELLEGFPRAVIAADAELIATSATDEMYHGSLDEAERQLALAAHAPEPGERRAHFLVRLGLVRLLLARRRGDLPAVVEEAERLLSPAESLDAVPLGLHEDLRAIALVNLGVAELWTARLEQAERHIEQGLVLARRIDRPFMEVIALAHGAIAASFRSFSLSAKLSMEAIEVARRHGWSDDPLPVWATQCSLLRGSGRDGWRRQSSGSTGPDVRCGRGSNLQPGWFSTALEGSSRARAAVMRRR